MAPEKPFASQVPPLYYASDNEIFQRPVRSKRGVRLGFSVCTVHDGIDPAEVCAILNRGEPATE